MIFFFFFSSRRRHTRSLCDWSSDVCSSDLDPFTPTLMDDGISLHERGRFTLPRWGHRGRRRPSPLEDRKSTRLNSSHTVISYAVFCLKKKKKNQQKNTQNTNTKSKLNMKTT